MSENTEQFTITTVYEEYYKQIHKSILQDSLKNVGRHKNRGKAPNKNKSKLVLHLIARMYEIPLSQLKKTSETYNQDDWLREARGMLYFIHYSELKWKYSDIENQFETKTMRIKTCINCFIDRKTNHKSTKDKFIFIIEKIKIAEL